MTRKIVRSTDREHNSARMIFVFPQEYFMRAGSRSEKKSSLLGSTTRISKSKCLIVHFDSLSMLKIPRPFCPYSSHSAYYQSSY